MTNIMHNILFPWLSIKRNLFFPVQWKCVCFIDYPQLFFLSLPILAYHICYKVPIFNEMNSIWPLIRWFNSTSLPKYGQQHYLFDVIFAYKRKRKEKHLPDFVWNTILQPSNTNMYFRNFWKTKIGNTMLGFQLFSIFPLSI